jgi:aromatase
MPQARAQHTEHEIVVAAPADAVYRLVADVANWPQLFPPTLHAERVEGDGRSERIRIWATANGEAKTWTSSRALDPAGLRVDFRQDVSAAPVAAMGGAWIIEPLSSQRSRVRLLHDYRAVGDDPQKLAWIDQAVDRNSHAELAALKSGAELAGRDDGTRFSFEDGVEVAGPVKDVYDFVDQAALWPQRLPHVSRVRLDEPSPGLQVLEMDTRAKDGSTHTTKSYRVTFTPQRIVYKQVTLPALLSLHTGRWTFQERAGTVLATSQHTVVLRTENIEQVLGPGASIAQAAQYVRGALSANSSATLAHAKAYAERTR